MNIEFAKRLEIEPAFELRADVAKALEAAVSVESAKSCSGASVRLAMEKAVLRLRAAQQ